MFIVHTDASLHSIGAVISQIQDGHEHIIAYGSKLLSKQERVTRDRSFYA